MLIVMDMESGKVICDPVMPETESCMLPPVYAPQAQLIPQPRLQEVSFPPRAVCPPPSLGVINVPLSTFDV
ncbi:MAG: hypothetical protein FWD67_09910 [Betaproteobacteria bacterium]|nr:hypothetical protein [Betaproteobacteria bacterium]